MSIQEWLLVAGFALGLGGAVSCYKRVLYQRFEHLHELVRFAALWGIPMALVGLWPLLLENGYTYPLGSLSAGIALGFFILTVGGLVIAVVMAAIIVLEALFIDNIPP